MEQAEALSTLSQIGAIIVDSHIVYTSGRHGSSYVNKDALYPHTGLTSGFCREIAKRFARDNVEVVIAPAVGGVILSQWTAFHLTNLYDREVFGVYADKVKTMNDDDFVIKRGYDKLVAGKRCLVVEDLLTTGGSVRKVNAAVRKAGGHIIGVGVLCNRGGVNKEDLGHVPRLEALVNVTMESWNAHECPLCRSNVPVRTDIGHGAAFLAAQRA